MVCFFRYIKQRCSNCKAVLDEPALCLLCGRLCSPNWKSCCRFILYSCCPFFFFSQCLPSNCIVSCEHVSSLWHYIQQISSFTFCFLTFRESDCQTHAMACGAGIGVFLLIKVCLYFLFFKLIWWSFALYFFLSKFLTLGLLSVFGVDLYFFC